MVQQPDDQPRIDGAAPGRHDQAFQRRKAHRGVNAAEADGLRGQPGRVRRYHYRTLSPAPSPGSSGCRVARLRPDAGRATDSATQSVPVLRAPLLILKRAEGGTIIGAVNVSVVVEVSGSPTACMHCWALGRNYRPMPIEEAALVLDELSGFCGERGLDCTAPMHEVTAHPAAPDMIRLFAPHLGEDYDGILTPGTPLASRETGRRSSPRRNSAGRTRCGSPSTATAPSMTGS
jgi:hypothetical protein